MEKEQRENSYSHILKYTGIFGSVQGLNILVGVLRNKFAALFLGPSGMGLLSLFNSTVNLISSSTNFGIPTTGVKIISEKMGEQSNDALFESIDLIRTYSLLSGILGMLATVVLGPVLNESTFSWGNHTLHYVLLAPIVFFTILAGGEVAILKATRQLKALAFTSSFLAVFSLLVSVPIYWVMGERGILGVLFLLAISQWAISFRYSVRHYPLRFRFKKTSLLSGLPLLRLGFAFVLAGMMNSGAEFMIRAYLNQRGDLELVGLFNAGVTIVIIYAGMVFSVMESDYYPRLSAIRQSGSDLNLCVNRQLEMNVLLIAPIIIAIVIALPIIIPLLYNAKFMGMLFMTQIAAFSMLFKAVYLPIEYLPLSRGESKYFLVQEGFAVAMLILCELVGFQINGLNGLGCGIVVAYFIESLAVLAFSRWHYHYTLSADGSVALLFQSVCCVLLACVVFVQDFHGILYWVLGALIFMLSTFYSLKRIRGKLNKG